ncbi:glycosyltransferase [Clostridium lacusfryxellense]|uniref:glycosyltransferase n=1 Tax=Clostridium lacusfryxellense TaxID=205328 RepID=UPI001C0CF92D|nr:glycosyltransferase [Clostridium lacusfryxellense]MBU3114598.1 glycosyltransferase [Clostridium lacusfryxellense]
MHIISGNDNGGGGKHVLNICNKSNKYFENIIGCVGEGPLYFKARDMDVNFKLFSKKLKNVELVNFINENSINIVNFHGAKPFLMHLILKNKFKVPTVAVVHSDFRYDFLNNKIKQILFTPLSIMGLKSFNNYICVSNNLKYLLDTQKIQGNKAVVNNGIDINEINIKTSTVDIRRKLELKNNDFIYIMVARLHPIKNHRQVLLAFEKLSHEFNDVKLLLVGDGVLRPEIEKLILELKLENRVIMTGNVVNPIEYINASNISVLVSLSEGGAPPLVVLESGIVKKSLIYTEVGDLENILDEKSGYKVKYEDNRGIYKTMKETYLDRNNLNIKGENLYNIVVNNFSLEKFWETYFQIYKTILK